MDYNKLRNLYYLLTIGYGMESDKAKVVLRLIESRRRIRALKEKIENVRNS